MKEYVEENKDKDSMSLTKKHLVDIEYLEDYLIENRVDIATNFGLTQDRLIDLISCKSPLNDQKEAKGLLNALKLFQKFDVISTKTFQSVVLHHSEKEFLGQSENTVFSRFLPSVEQ